MQTYPETQTLSSLLERVREEGAVRIQSQDGQIFVLTPEEPERSPFEVKGIHLGVSTEEIVEFIHEGRRG